MVRSGSSTHLGGRANGAMRGAVAASSLKLNYDSVPMPSFQIKPISLNASAQGSQNIGATGLSTSMI